MGSESVSCRVVVATHPASDKKSPVGVTRAGVVYELFFTNLPQYAFTASDVVELYLHRGAFEPQLSDEDSEQDPDRWCSHSAWGQECWQVVSQWVWNLRLELGHQLAPEPLRTTEFAPACLEAKEQLPHTCGYGKPEVAAAFKAGRFSGQDFTLQPDGTLRCPAQQSLVVHERQKEADGSLRVVYAASIRSYRPCPLREQCQWQGSATAKPRQVSVLLYPLVVGSESILWRDWSRRFHRRACIQLLRHQYIQGRSRASYLCQPGRQACAPFPCPTCPLSALMGRTAGSQCASPHGWPGNDQTVRHPRRLCHLARFGDGLTQS